jgi:hypothetical protein
MLISGTLLEAVKAKLEEKEEELSDSFNQQESNSNLDSPNTHLNCSNNLDEHKEPSITGENKIEANESQSDISFSTSARKHNMRKMPRTKGSIKKRLRPQNVPRSNVERRRRVRCHNCEPCTSEDCGECKYCKDMKKFGGTGISKQCCLRKQCIRSLLPTTTTCMFCGLLINRTEMDKLNVMYECEICFEIYHHKCFKVTKVC